MNPDAELEALYSQALNSMQEEAKRSNQSRSATTATQKKPAVPKKASRLQGMQFEDQSDEDMLSLLSSCKVRSPTQSPAKSGAVTPTYIELPTSSLASKLTATNSANTLKSAPLESFMTSIKPAEPAVPSTAHVSSSEPLNRTLVVIPAGGGKTTMADLFGVIDVDDLLKSHDHILKPLREAALRDGDWSKNNTLYRKIVEEKWKGGVLLAHAGTETILAGLYDKVYAYKPTSELHEKNIANRPEPHKLLSRLNFADARGTWYGSLYELVYLFEKDLGLKKLKPFKQTTQAALSAEQKLAFICLLCEVQANAGKWIREVSSGDESVIYTLAQQFNSIHKM
jgi:hypothetical protein